MPSLCRLLRAGGGRLRRLCEITKKNHHRYYCCYRSCARSLSTMRSEKTTTTATTTTLPGGLEIAAGANVAPGNGSGGLLQKLKSDREEDIRKLPETIALRNLEAFLSTAAVHNNSAGSSINVIRPPEGGYRHEMSKAQIETTLDAAMATFCLHVESRIAAMVGKGFYTIGPCGEEALGSIGLLFDASDSTALHYRHLGINLARQLWQQQQQSTANNNNDFLAKLLLDRARGYTVSRNDPVTGGVHCSIGSSIDPDSSPMPGSGDFIVTSTLASQCPSAVGRALAFGKRQKTTSSSNNNNDSTTTTQQQQQRPISFVTVGDGSVHNHHFWSALNLARHAKHRSVKCPLVVGISDNGYSISYETRGYTDSLFRNDPFLPRYTVHNGLDMMEVYDQTHRAILYARQRSCPVVVLYKNIVRRFGHAATDRQSAYIEQEQIQAMANTTVLESAMVQALDVFSAYDGGSYSSLYDRFKEIQSLTQKAFEAAIHEPKVTRDDMLARVSQPLIPVPRLPIEQTVVVEEMEHKQKEEGKGQGDGGGGSSVKPSPTKKTKIKKDVMRKQMNRVFDEILTNDPSVVYIGEDVEHGGYYVVTEGLSEKFPGRVLDVPPDETSLLGVGMGFSQTGHTPIVEIPYAKYLDCGADIYYEIAVMNWLSNGQRPNGMVIRLQGFDRGLFGGNFHTHNMLSHIPPGIDVVCYSNGEDYVKGMRNAIIQAKAGRVVVSVDCTHLLNLRHLHDKDRGWLRPYPPALSSPFDNNSSDNTDYYNNGSSLSSSSVMNFHDVRRYGTKGDIAILTYGNGVVTALQARKKILLDNSNSSNNNVTMDVIDCPYLSSVPDGLKEIITDYRAIVFADICKDGPGSNILSSTVMSLQKDGLLPPVWDFVAAPRTYNPLGNTETFLNRDDIERTVQQIAAKL